MITIGVFLDTPERTTTVASKLNSHPDLTVTAMAASMGDLILAVKSTNFHVSLVRAEAMEKAVLFRSTFEQELETCTTRLFLTTRITVGQVAQAVHTGYDNYLLESDPVNAWYDTISTTVAGTSTLKSHPLWEVAGHPVDMTRLTFDGLADADRDVIALLSEGLTNDQIADILNISGQTVRNKVSRVMDLVGVNNRTQLALTVKRSLESSRPWRG